METLRDLWTYSEGFKEMVWMGGFYLAGVLLYQIYRVVFLNLFEEMNVLAEHVRFSNKVSEIAQKDGLSERYSKTKVLRMYSEKMYDLVERLQNKDKKTFLDQDEIPPAA